MYKNLTIISFLGLLSVVLGAFGSHGLKEVLTIDQMNSFQTAVRYQFIHVIVLLFVNVYQEFTDRLKKILTLIFLLGIIFFSGSIYAITILKIPAKSIWFVTPLGGLLFVVGWLYMVVIFLNKSKNYKEK